MNEILNDLTKEDLIRVIANLSDGTDWRDGYGFTDTDAEKLNKISKACIGYCIKTLNWEIPNL